MKKLRLGGVLLLLVTAQVTAQKLFREVPTKRIKTEKVNYAKGFILEFLNKCTEKNYTSEFKESSLSNHLKGFFDKNIVQTCNNNDSVFGHINVQDLNSVYIDQYTNLHNPKELYIYNASTEKNKEVKYVSVWMSQNEKEIDGIWISSYKPLEKPKK